MLPGPGDSLTLQAGEGGEEGLREGQGELTWKPPSISPQQAQMLTKNLFLLGRRLMLMGGTNP